MNLRKNRGYVGVDVTIALMVIVILIPTITAITFNINKTSNSIQRKTQAVSIASNILETAKIIIQEEDEANDDEVLEKINEKIDEVYTEGYTQDDAILKTIDNVLYKIDVDIKDKHEIDDSIEEGKIKVVTAVVTYKVGNGEQNISLSTNFAINN